jgi:taurine dioxygenase
MTTDMAVRFAAVIEDSDRVRSLGPFGVEVDFDLRQPLDADDAQAFRDLFFRESLLLFRGQTLTMDDQQRVVEYVGPVLPGSGRGFLSPEDKVLGTVKLDYHSDLCATPMPLDAISLHALDVVEGTSTTNFVSGARAWRMLPDDLRNRIETLDVNFVQTLADRSRLSYDVPPDALNLVRPFVMRHRITGTPIVYANESSAARVEGLGREESRALLDAVFERLYSPSNEIRHAWRPGDFILWDNLALQHGRPPLDPAVPRYMQRVASGRRTLREQVPNYNLSGVFGES